MIVVGDGASASDLAGLLRDVGAEVLLVTRRPSLKFAGKPPAGDSRRPLWQRVRHPASGLGPGLRSRFYADAPILVHYLPKALRVVIVRTHLGPAGGWFAKEKVLGRVTLLVAHSIKRSEIRGSKVCLHLRAADGTVRAVVADHVISATGYRVDVARLNFLTAAMRSKLKTIGSAPELSSNFESSIPGLFFVGAASANSFGPVMRFCFGARFTARKLSRAISKSLMREVEFDPSRRMARS